MKRNKILKILLLTLLSSCSSNASSTNEAKSNSENSGSIKNSTSQDYDIILCDEIGELLTLVENPKHMTLSKEIKIKFF